ncbi:MAG: c-type cytochrome biogenesis protein CcmI [Gammaproteobacteria bacterium]|nr:c-type cytochrome biogenesis protein CcmI [Gammaproteobacteria bacterium]
MWVLWAISVGLVVVALALLIRPLFKTYSDSDMSEKQKKANQRKALNIELYEQKKTQIEQDFNNGLLDEAGRVQAQNEIEHSLLQDAEGSASKELTQLSSGSAKKLAVSFLVFVPVLSMVIYLFIMPDNYEQVVFAKPQPKMHGTGAQNQVPDIASMVTSLENKLKENPDNALGWSMLGRSYVVLKRHADAADAYQKALVLVQQGKSDQEMPELEIDYVEALMQIGEKEAYLKAQVMLGKMLEADPDNADALWFVGFLDYDAGNKDLAIKHWTHLLTLLPPTGEQANIVTTYLNKIKSEGGANAHITKNTATTNTQPAPASVPQKGPAPNQQLTGTAEEQAFIASMVARVEQRVKENPNDAKGWQSLGKSYGVLNRDVDSANAYAKAVELNGADANLLMAYSDAVMKTKLPEQLEKARIIFAQLVDNNPQNLDALFLGGSLARAAGDKEGAKQFWEILLPQLPPESQSYYNVERNLQSL